MSSDATDHLSPLAYDLRSNDPDRYLATLFAPPALREPLIALYSFDYEVVRVRRIVSEPMAGLVRLQWWDDIIDGFDSGRTVAHPVVEGLRRAVAEHGLDVASLKKAIDGRRYPFEHEPSSSFPSFKDHHLDAGGAIATAAAKLLGARDPTTLDLAKRVGLVKAAWDECLILKASAAGSKPWSPSAWTEGEGKSDKDKKNTRARLSSWALTELAEARHVGNLVARPTLAAFFPGTLAGVRLQSSARTMQQSALPSAVPRLIWYWMRRRF